MDELPRLIEPGVKSFLNSTLKTCREFKNKYNNTLLNIGLFIGLAFIIFFVLLVKFKGKPTFAEKERKNKDKQQYILSKIKNFQDSKLRAQQSLITGLPQF